MCKFIKANEVICLALILDLVLCGVHGAKLDLRAGRKGPGMRGRIVLRSRIDLRIILQALIDKLCELWVCLTNDQSLVMWDFHLSQGFND